MVGPLPVEAIVISPLMVWAVTSQPTMPLMHPRTAPASGTNWIIPLLFGLCSFLAPVLHTHLGCHQMYASRRSGHPLHKFVRCNVCTSLAIDEGNYALGSKTSLDIDWLPMERDCRDYDERCSSRHGSNDTICMLLLCFYGGTEHGKSGAPSLAARAVHFLQVSRAARGGTAPPTNTPAELTRSKP